jgi:RND family efflux transporter MFP subunit
MLKSTGLGLLLSLVSLPGLAAQWTGTVDWLARTELGTSASGMVTSVPVKAGDRVKKGQLLLQLEQEARRARLAQRKAEMKHRELMLGEARKELDRAEELYARTLLADHDLDVAKIAYADADALYQASRAALAEAQEEFDNSTLRAPYDAVVLARHVQPAETVINNCQSQPLLTLAPASRMRVRIFVASDKLATLAAERSVTVSVAGERYPGQVEGIGYEGETFNDSVRYPVDVVFNSGDALLVGQDAKVSQP